MSLSDRFNNWRRSKKEPYIGISYRIFKPISDYVVRKTNYTTYIRRAAFETPTRYYVSSVLLDALLILVSISILSNVFVIPQSLVNGIINISLSVLQFTSLPTLLGGAAEAVSSTIASSVQSILAINIESQIDSIRASLVEIGQSNQIIGLLLAPIAIVVDSVISPLLLAIVDFVEIASSRSGSSGTSSPAASDILDSFVSLFPNRDFIRNVIAFVISPIIALGYLCFKLYWPIYVSNERGRKIDANLSRSYTFLYALSRGGLGTYESMVGLSGAEDAYGEVSVAYQKIIRNSNKAGESLSSSIRNAAEFSPSSSLRSFLNGLTNAIETGSDVDSYIKSRSERSQKKSRKEQQNRIETYEFISEGYVIVFVVAPILLLVVFIVQGFSGSINKAAAQGVPYVLVPVGSLLISGVVYIIGGSSEGKGGTLETAKSSRWYEIEKDATRDEEYQLFTKRVSTRLRYIGYLIKSPFIRMKKSPRFTLVFTVPIVLILMIGSILSGAIPVEGYTEEDVENNPNIDEQKTLIERIDSSWLNITILMMYLPAMIILIPWSLLYEAKRRKNERVVRQLPQLFSSIAQSNKRGLTLQESLESVSKSSDTQLYNTLQDKMRKSSVTKDLNASLAEFSNEIRVQRLTQSVRLLVESSKVSNDINAVVEEIADDLENYYQLRKNRKQSGRMSLVTILVSFFIGAGIIISMDIMFFTFISDAVSSSGSESQAASESPASIDLPQDFLRRVFAHTILLLGLASGLVAGMMENGNPANGFKYSIIFSTLSFLSYVIVPTLV